MKWGSKEIKDKKEKGKIIKRGRGTERSEAEGMEQNNVQWVKKKQNR